MELEKPLVTKTADTSRKFIEYFAEMKKEYKYTLKFAVPDMTDEMIDCIESSLAKYGLKSATAFKKTPIQENPLDFPNVQNMPVFIADIVLDYPSSHDFLRTYLGNSLGISPILIAIYCGANDPREIETDLFLKRSSPDFKKDYVTKLGTLEHEDEMDEVYTDMYKDQHYGEKYNIEFLKELEKVRKERKLHTFNSPLSNDEKVDHSTLPKDYEKWNDENMFDKNAPGLFGRMKKPAIRKTGGQ